MLHFYALSGTNLLTRCHSACSYFLLFFYSRFLPKEIFSELDETKAKVPIFLTRRWSPKERRRRASSRHTRWWHGPALGHAMLWCGPPGRPLTSPFYLKIHFIWKTLRARASIHEKYCKPPPSSTLVREGPEALPGTLPERGIITGGLLHHHACLRSDA
jgi:hypothetical protein